MGNAQDGVRIENAATQTLVGVGGSGNVISGNKVHGVFINGAGCTSNKLQGNFIAFVRQRSVTTNDAGNASFTVTLTSPVPVGEGITATATNPDGTLPSSLLHEWR